MEKDLADAKSREETLESDHKSSLTKLSDALKLSNDSLRLSEDSRAELAGSLEKAQIDILSAGDIAFDRAKEQVLCLHPGLDISEIDYFKEVQDDRLMDMVEHEDDNPRMSPAPVNDDGSVNPGVNAK